VKLLDRYIVRNFLQPYVYCIVGFLSIWLIFDISDNISTLLDQRIPLLNVAQFYVAQLPQILVILLPVALLLALLFCLGKMSRSNEIVSMLTAGVSVPRVLLPLIGVGVLTALASTAMNYSLAPHAEVARKQFLENNARRQEMGVNGQIFRNRTDNRTWFIQHFKLHGNVFETVQVLQQNDRDDIVRSYLATRAIYDEASKKWQLDLVKVIDYDEAGNITHEALLPSLEIGDWSETPYRLSSANVRAEYLGVSELQEYLHFNSDFPETLLAPFATHLQHRIALPWTCLIVVFIAAPLGIGFSRRGILSSVASAIVLVFSMNFLTHLFLALGEGDRISPWAAAWTPNMIFAAIGLYLLHLRSTNRDTIAWNPASWSIFARR
jgi:LPS export ABC transporter permease LptG